MPIYEGYPLPNAIMKLDIGGKDLTDYLMKLMNEKKYLSGAPERWMVKDIKEKLCYITSDYDGDLKICENSDNELEKNYEISSGVLVVKDSEHLNVCLNRNGF